MSTVITCRGSYRCNYKALQAAEVQRGSFLELTQHRGKTYRALFISDSDQKLGGQLFLLGKNRNGWIYAAKPMRSCFTCVHGLTDPEILQARQELPRSISCIVVLAVDVKKKLADRRQNLQDVLTNKNLVKIVLEYLKMTKERLFGERSQLPGATFFRSSYEPSPALLEAAEVFETEYTTNLGREA